MKKSNLIAIGIIILAGILLFVSVNSASNKPRIGALGSEHTHSTWDFIADGRNITDEIFNTPQYQIRHRYVHMEDRNIVIHKHATGITFGFFLETLGVKWNKKCLTIEQEQASYCTAAYDFKFYVNNQEKDNFYSYEMRDNDMMKFELKST